MLEIKYSVTETMNAFDRLISRLGMAEEITSGLENISIEIYKIEMKRQKKKGKYGTAYPRNLGQLQDVTYLIKDSYPKYTKNS